MMKLDKDTTKKVAKLANLNLTEEQTEEFSKQLSETLSYIDKLEELDTSKVEPTSSVTGLSNIYSPDVVESSLTQDQALQNSRSDEQGYFKVKAIFENEP